METLYITDNGVVLKRKSNRIVLKKDKKVMEEIPILDLKRLVIFGNNQISVELMRYLSSKGIEVAFLSSHGKYRFRLVPETSKNIYLRMAQHRYFDNMEFRIAWSRIIVDAKLKNQRSMLIRSVRNQPEVDLKKELVILKGCLESLKDKQSLDEIMGVEGYGSKIYFRSFARLIRGDFIFTKRAYYPPPDPVNAMLSFGYMILLNEINGILEAMGFDVFLGFLHGLRYGRTSLGSDLIEELRSPVVDRLVIYLINLGVIKPSHFNETEDKGVRMTDGALKAYLSNYERFMTTPFVEKTGNSLTYRKILQINAEKTEKVLLDNISYVPYFMRQ